MISLIVAMAQNRVIGKDNKMPWHLPGDLQYFKSVTMGKPILMGRKTFEAIGRPLPGRMNIILTRDATYIAPGCIVLTSIEDVYKLAVNYEEFMVIGGAQLYHLFLPKAQKIYMTVIDHACEGDAFFPELDMQLWQEVSRKLIIRDDKNDYNHSFVTLVKKEVG